MQHQIYSVLLVNEAENKGEKVMISVVGVYSGSRLSEIQEPHPQPPHRLRGGGYDVFHSSAYRYN
ncbi:hypothetical protein ACSQ6I_03130 [Anabaena sp. WFMT]|uniref:hypothetical protein n=1 Tax=Anabaena sp. WFMT TaxID=3449730 RepID=UPI003F1FDC97